MQRLLLVALLHGLARLLVCGTLTDVAGNGLDGGAGAGSDLARTFRIDAFNHLQHRGLVLSEWRRVLRPGGLALVTDPVVVTGAVTDEELMTRSSIGRFLFTPPGLNWRSSP